MPNTRSEAERKVKAVWANAVCVRSDDGFFRIWNGLENYSQFKMLGKAGSTWEAWLDAAARLERKEQE